MKENPLASSTATMYFTKKVSQRKLKIEAMMIKTHYLRGHQVL